MIEYKQWHESLQDFIYFNSECAVSFCQCDKNHKLSLFELLRLVTEAAVEDLMRIPGIGEVKARSIIEYREANGRFQGIEDITKVSGIGEKTFEKIRDYICV